RSEPHSADIAAARQLSTPRDAQAGHASRVARSDVQGDAMKIVRVGVGLIGVSSFAVLIASASAHGQAQRANEKATADESTAMAVLVDVVVRDKHGKPVTDLQAEDFELREDDARQTLGSFTRVSRGAGIGINVGLREPGTTLITPPGSADANETSGSASAQTQADTTPAATAPV